jgi:hypothetical protein
MVEHGPAGNLSQSEMSLFGEKFCAWRCMIRVKQIMVGLCTSAILGLTAGSRSKIPIVWTQRHWSLDRRSVHTFGQSCSTAASEENNGPDMLLSLIATPSWSAGSFAPDHSECSKAFKPPSDSEKKTTSASLSLAWVAPHSTWPPRVPGPGIGPCSISPMCPCPSPALPRISTYRYGLSSVGALTAANLMSTLRHLCPTQDIDADE